MRNGFRLVSMNRILALLVLVLSFGSVRTQTVAKMEFLNGYWIMDVEAGNKLVHESLQSRYGEANIKSLDVIKLKNQFQEYISDNVIIHRDSVIMKMNPFHVELNSVRGQVRVISPRFEDPGQELIVEFRCFDDVGRSVRVIVIPNVARCVDILNADNDFHAVFRLDECTDQ